MSKILAKIGSFDLTPFIKSYQLDYNVLVKDEGRNARGNLTLTVLNRKAKVNLVFRPLNETEMKNILVAIQPFVFTVEYWDAQTQTQKTASMYVNTASPNFYTNAGEVGIFNDMSLNFIEL